MGKSLQHYNKAASNRDNMFVWRHPANTFLLGFGDGHVADPSEDPIGISSVWLHVHKEIFFNYVQLGDPQVRHQIRIGSLYLCRAHYMNCSEGIEDFCNEWTCGKTSTDIERDGWTYTRKTRRKIVCRRCLVEFNLR